MAMWFKVVKEVLCCSSCDEIVVMVMRCGCTLETVSIKAVDLLVDEWVSEPSNRFYLTASCRVARTCTLEIESRGYVSAYTVSIKAVDLLISGEPSNLSCFTALNLTRVLHGAYMQHVVDRSVDRSRRSTEGNEQLG